MTGLEPVPVAIDERGLDAAALDGHDVAAVLVAPAHSYPTGATLDTRRRRDLVAWARRRDALIIEDDYDAEFRYDRVPIGALQGLAPDRVVYLGSASKTVSPALRLGWVAAPPAPDRRAASARSASTTWAPACSSSSRSRASSTAATSPATCGACARSTAPAATRPSPPSASCCRRSAAGARPPGCTCT